VGGVCVNLEQKLVDIPEMNYLVTDVDEKGNKMPRGELCNRGFGIVPGYYMEKDKTNEAIDANGWLHTGDVGQLLPNGAISIIDRKKNLFKLSQGVYLAPEKIENIYVKISYISEAFVTGDPLKSFCIGFFVADPDIFPMMASELGFKGTFEELCNNQELIKLLWWDIFQ